ncbi:hypothetical protein GMORB2_0235 [Geosmithia morbida]|uniref:Sequence orphan n=1 Tax=Geosmithia morbida TaxID=1094350 RepID=A0A9P5D9G4_9HYPO|nr:uncharacterized protein GMORB2_0235 [Geosmithia morbida]KAF4126499.1 hypothetical protein GMORB2_0235 [Geosmithia morbida]
MAQQTLKPGSSPTGERTWNTDKLGLRLGFDAISAACAGALVAPVIYIIDKSIMENASGRQTLVSSIKSSLRQLVTHPRSTLLSKPTGLIFLLYGGTYLTANALDTATSTLKSERASHVTSGTAKFAASSAANIGLCIYKDQVFVRMFGPPGAVPRPVPSISYALFTLRDCLTIFASFNLPPLLGPILDERLSDRVRRHVSGMSCAQFAAPAAVQVISTPLHLLGLDMYNRPSGSGAPSWSDRWAQVKGTWAPSTLARMCRIIPAFGVGGVVNRSVRENLMHRVE